MTIKYHVASIHVMSLPPKNFVVTITRYDDVSKEIDQAVSNNLTERQAKQAEKILKKAVSEKGFTWKRK